MAVDKPILTGETVILRPITAEDGDRFFETINDTEVNYYTGTQDTFTLEQVRNFYARIPDEDDRADYAIVLKSDQDVLLGEAVLNDIDWENRSTNFRIALNGSEHFGKGYGSQATELIVRYAFEQLDLHRIELEVYDFNPRAQRVYEKAGFKKEGVRRDVLYWKGKYHSAIVMSVLRPEFDA